MKAILSLFKRPEKKMILKGDLLMSIFRIMRTWSRLSGMTIQTDADMADVLTAYVIYASKFN